MIELRPAPTDAELEGPMRHDDPAVAEDRLTVVWRDWRRRGLAAALKPRELSLATISGVREIVTWTQRGNAGRRRLNERLGTRTAPSRSP